MLLRLIVWLFDWLFIYLFVYLFAGFPLSFHWLSTNISDVHWVHRYSKFNSSGSEKPYKCLFFGLWSRWNVILNHMFFALLCITGSSSSSFLYIFMDLIFLFCVQQSEQQKCRAIDCTGRAINAAIANTSLLQRWFPRFFFLGISNNQKQKLK